MTARGTHVEQEASSSRHASAPLFPLNSRSTPARSTIERVVRFFRGDDVFVSYSRKDGVRYATGLARELTRRKLACRIDFWETVPGTEIPEALRRAIRRSGLLAIVGSPGACSSSQVAMEIREFLPTRRNLVPIAVGETVDRAIWFSMVEGLTIEEEPETSALDTGSPAESVIKRIEDSCDFRRRNQRLRRTFLLTTIATFLLVAGATAWSTWNLMLARQAEGEAREATNRANVADASARSATELANRQKRLASARQAAFELEDRQTANGFTSVTDTPKAIQNGRELLSLDETVEASAGLSRRFALVATSIEITIAGLGSPIMSPDGKRVAAPVNESTVVVLQASSLEEISRLRTAARATTLVFSADGDALAVGAGNRVTVFDVRSGMQVASVESPEPVSRLSISRDRRFLAGVTGENIHVWNLSEQQLQTIPAEGEVDDLVFTVDGTHLAVRVFENGGGDVLLLVDLSTQRWSRGPLLDESGSLLALSPDGRFVGSTCRVGTAPDDCTTRVWTLPDLAELAQLPTRDFSVATFSPDGSYLATTESGETRIWETRRGLLLGVIPDRGVVAFSPNGQTVAVAGRRGVTAVSTINGLVAAVLERDGLEPRESDGTTWSLTGLTSDGNNAVVSNQATGEIETWLMEGIDRAPGLAHSGEITERVISEGGQLLVFESVEDAEFERSGYATLWDIETSERLLHVRPADLPASA